MLLRKQHCIDAKEIVQEQSDVVATHQIYSAEDALVEVFSFLHISSIGLLPPVCKLWRNILIESDALWKQLYKSHFSLHYHQSLPANQSWSNCFQAAFKADKGRQKIMKVTNLGWPTKLCPFVGCYTVLYNETAYSKHILTHEQKSLMQKKKRKNKKYDGWPFLHSKQIIKLEMNAQYTSLLFRNCQFKKNLAAPSFRVKFVHRTTSLPLSQRWLQSLQRHYLGAIG